MFKIQISNPEILSIVDNQDTTIEEAIESIFPLDTEFAFIVWNDIYIPLSYKYDVSVMINDFLKIQDFIKDKNIMSMEIHWASNTFSSIWFLSKESELIKIRSKWNNVMGRLVDLLNENNEIIVLPQVITDEINRVTNFIKPALEKSGYNADNLNDFNQLEI